ncbi:MAG: hypothetical protein KBB54_03770 [Candidatus Pacebacteria bacterium]|nr:hypothetical protein [Candidatus Paceibacterota bacterium]
MESPFQPHGYSEDENLGKEKPVDNPEKVSENTHIEGENLFKEELYYELKLTLPIKWEKVFSEHEIYRDTDPNATSRYASSGGGCVGLRAVPQGIGKGTAWEKFVEFNKMVGEINLPPEVKGDFGNSSLFEETIKSLPQTCEATIDVVFPLRMRKDYNKTKVRVDNVSSYSNEKIGYETLFGKPLELIKGIPSDFFEYKHNAWDQWSWENYSQFLPKEVLENFNEDWREWMKEVENKLELPSWEEVQAYEYKLATSKK